MGANAEPGTELVGRIHWDSESGLGRGWTEAWLSGASAGKGRGGARSAEGKSGYLPVGWLEASGWEGALWAGLLGRRGAVGEDCACARSGGRTAAGGAESELRWWAGLRRGHCPAPPTTLCAVAPAPHSGRRGGGAARAAASVAAMDLGGCPDYPFSALVVCVPKPATRAVLSGPGLKETSGSGKVWEGGRVLGAGGREAWLQPRPRRS